MARRRGGLLTPANDAQVAALEAAFAAGPASTEGKSASIDGQSESPRGRLAVLQDPTSTVRTNPAMPTMNGQLGNPVSPMSPPELVAPSARPKRRFRAWGRSYLIGVAIADATVGALAAAVPTQLSDNLYRQLALVSLLAVLGAVVWPIAIGLARGYLLNRVGVGSEELRAVLRAGVGVVVIGAFAASLRSQQTLLTLVVVAVPSAVVLSTLARFVARRIMQWRQNNGIGLRQVVVVGSAAAANEFRRRLDKEGHCGMKVVGACLPQHEMADVIEMGIPVLGELADVATVVARIDCDAIAVTSDESTRHNYLRKLAWSLEGSGIEMLVDPGLADVAGPRMHIRPLMGAPLLHIEEPHFSGWRKAVKRTSDVLLTTFGLVAISPVLLVIAALIKLQDGGPVLFRQKRVGRGGEEFWMYKFRSMVVEAERRKSELMARNEGKGGLFKLSDDPRITPLGKFLRGFSLDELPQLLNVLNGTMSLVGPRPHLAAELALMPSEASRRALVTPGLTGLWQVSGRSDLEGDDAVRLDLWYVENWTLTLDLHILWKTASAVLARRGAR